MIDRTNADIWTKLRAPLPPEAIQQRQGQGNRMLDYIDRPAVWERLDSLVAGEWDFHAELIPGSSGNGDEPFAVKGRLSVLGVTREDIGQGKDMKEAATDAFKRCAVHFGIGRELYAKGHTPARQAAAHPRAAAPAPAPQRRTDVPVNPEPYEAQPTQDADPACPACGGKMWDNRATKKNPKAPNFKCRDRACTGVIWPPKPGQQAQSSGPLVPENVRELAEVLDMEPDSLPF